MSRSVKIDGVGVDAAFKMNVDFMLFPCVLEEIPLGLRSNVRSVEKAQTRNSFWCNIELNNIIDIARIK